MIVLNHDQNSEEWAEARKGKITGSKLKGLIVKRGSGRKLGFYELMAEKLSLSEEPEDPMERGHRLQDEALRLFEEKTGVKTVEVGLCLKDGNKDIACSPDALIERGGRYPEAVEIKCLSPARHLQAYFEKKVPDDYDEQAVQYFIVNDDLEKLYFVFYDPRITALPLFYIEISRAEVEEKIKKYYEYQVQVLSEIDELLEELF